MQAYKILKHINWRKGKGFFMLLDPKKHKLKIYNKKISATVTRHGIIVSKPFNRMFIEDLLGKKIIRKIAVPNTLDYSCPKEVSAPFNVTVQLTNRCNLGCSHCHREYGKISTMTLAQFKKLARDLRSMNVFNVNFSGGEPCLIESFSAMVSYADKIGLKVTMSTNNTLMTEKLAKTLKQAGLFAAHISLDSADPRKHDKIRGKDGAFWTMKNNLRHLTRQKIKYIFVTTLSNQSIKDYKNTIDLAYRLKAYGHKTNTLIFEGRAKGKRIAYYQDRSVIEKYVKVWRQKKEEYQNKMEIIAETMFELQVEKSVKATQHLGTNCPAGILTCAINENGDVIPCSFFSSFVVGNIFVDSFPRIWEQSKKLKQIRLAKCHGCKARAYDGQKFNTDPYWKGNYA